MWTYIRDINSHDLAQCSPFGGGYVTFHPNLTRPWINDLTKIGVGGDLSSDPRTAQDQIRILKAAKFRYVLDLRAEWDDADLWKGVPGITYVRIPGHDDGQENTYEWWEKIYQWWTTKARYRPTYVHCHLGVNRAPAVATMMCLVLQHNTSLVTEGWPEAYKANLPKSILNNNGFVQEIDPFIATPFSPAGDMTSVEGMWKGIKKARPEASPKYISNMLEFLFMTKPSFTYRTSTSQSLRKDIEARVSRELMWWEEAYKATRNSMITTIKRLRQLEDADLAAGRDRRHSS